MNKNDGAPLSQKIAESQVTLASKGARHWPGSNGELIKTEGGYLFSGSKHFASQFTGRNLELLVRYTSMRKTNGACRISPFH